MHFIPDKLMDVIFSGKSFNNIILMFPNSFDKIRRYSNIKSPISCTRQNIHSRLFDYRSTSLDSGLRRNDKMEMETIVN